MRLFFSNRPLAACALIFTLGIALGRMLSFAWLIGTGAVILALVFFFFFKSASKSHKRPVIVLACAVSLLLGVARYAAADIAPANGVRDGLLEGRLSDDAYLSGTAMNMALESVTLNAKPVQGRVLLKLYSENFSDALPEYGAKVRVKAQLRPPSGIRNPGGYDERLALNAKSISLVASGAYESASFTSERDFSLYGSILGLRRSMASAIGKALLKERSALMQAMLFGDKQQLSESTYADFRLSGAAHVLAVSGLHVMALAMALGWLLERLRVSRMKAFTASSAFLLLYCVLAALVVSVVRASIMALIVLFARVCGRKHDALTSMSAAAAAILMANPYQLFTPGFQLSFCAVFGIFALTKPINGLLVQCVPAYQRSKKWAAYVTGALAVSIAAQIATIPPMLYWFQSVTPVGILTNLIVVPLAGVTVTCGLPFAALCALFPAVGALLAPFIGVLLDALSAVAKLFALKGGVVFLPPPHVLLILLFLALCLMVFVYYKRRPRRGALCALAMCVALALGVGLKLLPPPGTQIVMLDVGQGDSILIRSGGSAMLIDAGSARRLDYGEAVVLPALRTMGVLRLDAILMSHPDEDHMGGISAVLNSMRVSAFLGDARDPKSENILNALEASGTPHTMPKAGQQFALGGANLLIVRAVESKTTNESSIAALLSADGVAALFTGDLDANSERSLSRLGEITVLKVAHHGSKYSTAPAFVNQIKPKLALVSVGKNNYGHPDPDVLTRLESQGASVMRTDTDGAVFVSIARDKIEVRAMLARDKIVARK